MNRIHAISKTPDGIFLEREAVYPPLHMCPVSQRIVSCAESCPDCARLLDIYEAQFHAYAADQMFGPQTRIDAGIEDRSGSMILWFLDVMKDWPAEYFWMTFLLFIAGFWAVVAWMFIHSWK